MITTIPVLGADRDRGDGARARAAQPGWEALGFEGRGKVLRRAQKWMLDNAERVIDVVVSESGKTHEDAQLADFGYTVSALGFWAKEAPKYLADERVPSWNNPVAAGKKLVIRYAPVGVVGVIGPWNYPIANSFGDCIPALAAGNSVILKPSEVTPLSSLLMEEMMRECGLPEDVFQVATGDGSTGAALIPHVDCDDVHRLEQDRAGGDEGGRRRADPVLPRARRQGPDDRLRRCRHRARRERGGVLLDEQRRPGLHLGRARVRRGAGLRRVRREGHRQHPRAAPGRRPPASARVDIGAVTFPPQLEIIDEHVRDAVAKGAKVLVGGHRAPGAGRFYEPTVLVDVDHSMKCMQEETFGPTIPIMKIRDSRTRA